jgi:halocyanin-like protein
MHDPSDWSRREFVTTALVGTGALAGCLARGEEPSASSEGADAACLDDWLADANIYDGTVVDWRDYPSPVVTVGSAEGESPFTFSPPAARVSTGTTVRWVWTGGPHQISFEDADIGSPVETEPGVRFEHTFEETGVYRYACAPHQSLGAKGAIVVE